MGRELGRISSWNLAQGQRHWLADLPANGGQGPGFADPYDNAERTEVEVPKTSLHLVFTVHLSPHHHEFSHEPSGSKGAQWPVFCGPDRGAFS